MYFTQLIQLSSHQDFDSYLLSQYKYLVIAHLEHLDIKSDSDAVDTFRFTAKASNTILYVVDEPDASGATIDIANFLAKNLGKVFENVDWQRPFFLMAKTDDLIDNSPSFVDVHLEYIDAYFQTVDDTNREAIWTQQHSPEGYALIEAHKALLRQESRPLQIKGVALISVLTQIWKLITA